MPNRNGTGPMGLGPMTGRGLGLCTEAIAKKSVRRLERGLASVGRCGYGRGFGRGYAANRGFSKTEEEEMLRRERNVLQERLENIDKQLENL